MPAEPFLGEIFMFGGNFAPRGYALCDGQLLPIAQNTALFSILGTTFGGNGQTTFALPDLRGGVRVHPGQGPGLSSYDLGEQSGVESVTLSENEMPTHSHAANGQSGGGNRVAPTGGFPAADQTGNAVPYSDAANGTMNASLIA